MITQQTYALLALNVYAASPVNRLTAPPPWTEILPQSVGTDGFAYAVYKNPDTNEVVISFRGTDNDLGDWTTNLGISLSQEKQAAAVYARVLRDYGTDAQGNDLNNITFTGHSLGGGLAATMAVWFNRPAVVFDPAPSQSSATNQMNLYDVVMSLGAVVPQSIRDYWADITTQFAAREPNVISYYAPGSIVFAGNTADNTITGAGQSNPVQFGIANMGSIGGMVDMHSQALLTAGLLSDRFRAATVTVQSALPLVMDIQLYALPPGGSDRNFLIDLIRSEQGTGHKLTHFAADLNKLGTNIAGLNKSAQDAIIAQGIEWYYWQGTDYAGQEFFTQTGELLQYTTAKGAGLQGAQNKASEYVRNWLNSVYTASTGDTRFAPMGTAFDQWNVAAGSAGVTATALDATKSQIYIGGAGSDTFTGGDLSDVVLAGDGSDTLNGGAGYDLLYGGAGDDTLDGGAGADIMQGGSSYDTYIAGNADAIKDSDGKGAVQLNGSTLTGGDKNGGGVYVGTDGTRYMLAGNNRSVRIMGNEGQSFTANSETGSFTVKTIRTLHYINNVFVGETVRTEGDAAQCPLGIVLTSEETHEDRRFVPRRGGGDPLALDLDGNGLQTISVSTSNVLFDHDNNGLLERTGWLSGGDGFLVLDLNNNQKIDNGTELFGDSTSLEADGNRCLGVDDVQLLGGNPIIGCGTLIGATNQNGSITMQCYGRLRGNDTPRFKSRTSELRNCRKKYGALHNRYEGYRSICRNRKAISVDCQPNHSPWFQGDHEINEALL